MHTYVPAHLPTYPALPYPTLPSIFCICTYFISPAACGISHIPVGKIAYFNICGASVPSCCRCREARKVEQEVWL